MHLSGQSIYEKMNDEKRRYQRYSVDKEVLYVASRSSTKIAVVKNISIAGLAFEYLPVAADETDWTTVDVFANTPSPFFLSSLKCKIIYDLPTLVEKRTFSGSPSRLCGLRYLKPTNEQNQKLEFLFNSGIIDLEPEQR